MIIIAILSLCALLSSLVSLSQIRFLRGVKVNLRDFLAEFSCQIPNESSQSVNFSTQNTSQNSKSVNFQANNQNEIVQNAKNTQQNTNKISQSTENSVNFLQENLQNTENLYSQINENSQSMDLQAQNANKNTQSSENSRFYEIQSQAIEIAIENEKFSIYSHLYELVLYALWIAFGFAWLGEFIISEPATLANPALNETKAGSILENTLFLLAFLIINTALSLPLSIYSTFVKDKKHGFSTITPALFVKDTLTSLALLAVFGFALIYALVFCYEFLGEWWWLAAAGVAFVAIVFINIIYPTLIVPLYNQLKPLQDSTLNEQIATLLRKCGLRSKGVFVIDASKRDKRLNAYFAGLSKARRVVLFDTLLRAFSERQLLAVLGHELGHFVHKDLLKGLVQGALMGLLLFFVIAHLPEIFYTQSHLDGVNAGVFALLIMLSGAFDLICSPFVNFLSRKNEFAADLHGAQMTSARDMREALLVLAMENKAFVETSKLYECFRLTHPSIAARVRALQ